MSFKAILICLFGLLVLPNIAEANAIPEFRLSDIQGTDIFDQLPLYDSVLSDGVPHREHLRTASPNPLGDVFSAVFTVTNDTTQDGWFIYPYGSIVDTIYVTAIYPDGTKDTIVTGYKHANFVDYHYGRTITIPPDSSVTITLAFDSEYFTSPIRTVFYPTPIAQTKFEQENVILMLSLGVCLALAIYNFFLFTGTREYQYLFYAFSTVGFTLGWSFTFGVPFRYLGIEEPWLAIPSFFLGLICAAAFTTTFLRLERNRPHLHVLIKRVIIGSVLALFVSMTNIGLGVLLASVFSTLILIISLYAGVTSWRSGYSPARYFVIALISVMVPNLVGNLMNLNVLPGLNINAYLLAQLGNSMDSLLLAFALADKVRMVNKQNKELTQSLEASVHRRTQELSETNERLQTAIADLEDANRAKDRFLANISHEIRTPLTSVIGYAEQLVRVKHYDKDVTEQGEIIIQNSQHLLSLINDMLDISKIEANKLEFERIPIKTAEFVKQIRDICLPIANQKGLEFEIECAFPVPTTFYTDKTRLMQILFNLTSNALKFTHRGNVKVRIGIRGETLHLAVIDSGIGMANTQLAKAFEAFEQGDISVARKYGGTGLGLNITKHLVEGLGGEIHLHSAEGEGTRVQLVLPVISEGEMLDDLDTTETHSLAEIHISPRPLRLSRSTVLLAEDNIHNRSLFKGLLESLNLSVIEARNGIEAIQIINHRDDIDLLILDIQMPEKSGDEVLLAARRAGFSKPAVAFTANHAASDIATYLRAGFSDCIQKPIDNAQMRRVLEYFIGRQNPLDDLVSIEDRVSLVEGFTADLKRRVHIMKQALDNNDIETVQSQAHAIKGAGESFGWRLAGKMAQEVEMLARNMDLAQLFIKVNGLEQLINWVNQLPFSSVPRTLVSLGDVSVLLEHWTIAISSISEIKRLLAEAQKGHDALLAYTQVCKLLFIGEKFHLNARLDITEMTDRLSGKLSDDALSDVIELAEGVVNALISTAETTGKLNKLVVES